MMHHHIHADASSLQTPAWDMIFKSDLCVMQYDADSAPAQALNATIARTERRFATYAKQGLLCGTDGLPHLISDPGLAIRYGHTGETLVRSCRGFSCIFIEIISPSFSFMLQLDLLGR